MDTFKKILDDVDEVDLTPMIDVTFLLLIYFMVTTMIKQPEAELSAILPGKSSPSSNYKTPPKPHKLIIDPVGDVTLEGDPTPFGNAINDIEMEALRKHLFEIKSTESDPEVHIIADNLVSWQAPLSVLNACGWAKIKKVSINP